VVSASAAAPRQARGGELDSSFGSGGLVTTDLTADFDSACCVALQSDGKLVVAGYEGSVNGSAGHAFVARYLPNGVLDPSFGGTGVVRPRFATNDDLVQAIAVQPDGKVVAAGSVVSPDTNIAIARYNADGSLDPSFGQGGKVVMGFASGSRERALALAIAGDGKLVVGGAARGPGLPQGNFLVARYNGDGSLDTSFGDGGKTITDFGALGEAHAVAIDSSGRVVAVGGTFSIAGGSGSWGKAFVSARYGPDGRLDTTFGGGKVSTDFGSSVYGSLATDVAIQPDGKIVSAGWVGVGNARATLVRHNADGALDATFGDGGKVVTEQPAEGSSLGGVALDSRGRLLAAGMAGGASLEFQLARFQPSGKLDIGFGKSGMVLTDFSGGSNDEAYGLVLQQDGKAVVVGGSDGKVALARYLPTYCVVPNIKGRLLAAATKAIVNAHCRVGKVTRRYSGRVRAGRVVSQAPASGVRRPEDAAVALVISRGSKR
jgi:uncharacterized delta-60 repeat protein